MEPDFLKHSQKQISSREDNEEGGNHQEGMEGNGTSDMAVSDRCAAYFCGARVGDGDATSAGGILKVELEGVITFVLLDCG